KVKTILASGDISILDHDQNKRTALHVAASEGHHELVHLLLELRADANAKDKFENTPVNDAVRTKHDKVIDVIRSHMKSIRYSLPGSQVGVELCEAAATGNLEQITRLLNNGVNVNEADYDGRTALHLACCEGHLHAVESLLKAQANVHCQDRFTGTALEDSVRHHFNNRTSTQIQELLRKHGASLEHKMQEYAAKMCFYASQGMLDNIKILVENGIAVNVGDYDSRTPLHLAASTGWTSVVEYLV
ncbi:hypothetical protein GUITHDRAFT_61596, partial [Guillardia theta CCMP2712]